MGTQRQQEATMFAKKLVLLTASGFMLSAASAAFADPPHWAPAHGWRAKHQNRHHVARPAYYPERTYYYSRPAYYPQRTYYYEPSYTYYEPAPAYGYGTVYYGGSGVATVGGAVAGAIIGNQISDRRHRGVATAAGAVLGAYVGSRLDYGY